MSRDFEKFKENINGKRVAVLGIGVSNQPLIKYIVKLGAKVTACDRKNKEEIGKICSEFESLGVELRLGPNYLDDLTGFDMVFRSPSIRPDHPGLIFARENGAYVTSEIEEFIKYCPGMVIGVTGSDGKTTTTTLIYSILKEEGYNAWLGGNIGIPLFDRLDTITSSDKVVLELSSFQLMDMDVSPQISVITNLSPNHLDIHKSMDEYIDSKKNIFRHQNGEGILILNRDNMITNAMAAEAVGSVKYFSRLSSVKSGAYLKGENLVLIEDGVEQNVCSMDDVKLLGMHNIENLLAAFAALGGLCSVQSMRKVASTFKGVAHRLEFVRELDGVKYYNDSIASSPTRAVAGLNSFNQKVILIAGGYDKKIPFDELARTGVEKVKTLILVGATADKIEDAFKAEMDRTGIQLPIIRAESLKEAVDIARSKGTKGDIVTLSPACASFDMYRNFEERGNKFKQIVNSLK